MNLLNSDFVQWLLKLAFSKSGVVIRWLVGYAMGALLAKNIIPQGDADTIAAGLSTGLTAIVAILYALFNYWLNSRRQKGVLVVQQLVGAKPDGVIGNETIQAVANATDQTTSDVHQAINNAHTGNV